MRLYSRVSATSVTGPDGTVYTPGDDGAFNLPEDFGQQQHSFHVGALPLWEDEIERGSRLVAEEIERRKDPAALLDAVQQIVAAAQAAAAAREEQDGPKGTRRRKPAAGKDSDDGE